ncbi:hypothetical protein CEXT_492421 [Caerostris extrusa]|uniref:Uncharacterized protein n=1 Tax=Caerostris extrusa TaxID=172846 RepID=A0AAV4NZU0_CAEEX|nr:hypothetical protein CEXT_492421 [Caerostris extrusa]
MSTHCQNSYHVILLLKAIPRMTNGTSAVPSREELSSRQGVLREIWHGVASGVVWKWMKVSIKKKTSFPLSFTRDVPWSSFPHTRTNGTSAVPSREELGSHQGVLMEIWHGIVSGVVWKWMKVLSPFMRDV